MELRGAQSIPRPGGSGSVGAPTAQTAPSPTCGWLCRVPTPLGGSWPAWVRVRGTMSTEMTPGGVASASSLSEALVSECSGICQCGDHMGTPLGHLGGHVGCVGGFALAGTTFVPIRFHQATWPWREREGWCPGFPAFFPFNAPLLGELDVRLIASIILLQPLWVIRGSQPNAGPINHSYTPGCYSS